ncbi:MAG: alcohol dehydrogenase catalytic domain-containing protein [Deltaproteobacteria bacterium]|nr:alcohol dehydrogenase catalytic domain-containing protein [Deltaproteobacteria bacterium]
MKAAVVYGENDIRITEMPTPSPGPGQVLIKVKGSGVCATDVKILGGSGLPKELPTILGHEVAGTIEALGEGVSGLEINQRVAVYPIAACGECFFCNRGRYNLCLKPYGLGHGADGGFAEYVLIPEQIVKLKGILDINDMPFDMAAMIEPISCCIAAAEQCRTKSGDNVLIIGCGPLGLLHVIVSKERGSRVIVLDINEERLLKAKEIGADITLNPDKVNVFEEVRNLTHIGADIVIAAVGSVETVEKFLPLVRNGGVFNIFGGTPKGKTINLDPRWLHYGEIVLTGTFAASLDQFRSSYEFVRENAEAVSKVISVRCGLDDILDAVERVKKGTALKSIIMFD